MTAVLGIVGRAVQLLGAFAGVLLLVMTAITFADVTGRYLFDRPLAIAFELVQVVMGTLVFAALPLVTAEDGHVSMGLLSDRLHGRVRLLQRSLAYGVCALLSCFWGAYVFKTAQILSGYGERMVFSGIPVGPFAYFMAAMIFVSAAMMMIVAVTGPLVRR